jgi:4-amino-4-deoxy-L-arabinose transferase-like glycosyltransferase
MTRIALYAGVGIFVIWVPGVLHATDVVSLPMFDLDKEGTIPQAYSGLLLLVAATAAYLAARHGAPSRRALLIIAGVLVYMSFDEVFRIHETLDAELNMDWQILYLPIVAVALIGWLGVEREIRGWRIDRALWIGAAACWVIAQALEVWQWHGHVRPGTIHGEGLSGAQLDRELHRPSYLLKMLPEELLETCGSLLFAFVLARLAERYADNRSKRRRAYLPAS